MKPISNPLPAGSFLVLKGQWGSECKDYIWELKKKPKLAFRVPLHTGNLQMPKSNPLVFRHPQEMIGIHQCLKSQKSKSNHDDDDDDGEDGSLTKLANSSKSELQHEKSL